MSLCLPASNRSDLLAALARCMVAGVFSLVVFSGLGCGTGNEQIDTVYGRSRGKRGGKSINGTSVLFHMFEEQGHRVHRWNSLSPRIDQYDVILWTPDSFAPPSEHVINRLQRWLNEGDGRRTLIYIDRSWEASIGYWEHCLREAPADQTIEIQRRLAEAKCRFALERHSRVTYRFDESWFLPGESISRTSIQSLSGPWSHGIQVDQTAIELYRPLTSPSGYQGEDSLTDIVEVAEWKSEFEYVHSWDEEEDHFHHDHSHHDHSHHDHSHHDHSHHDHSHHDHSHHDHHSSRPWEVVPLLASDEHLLAFRASLRHWRGSSIVVVANGSFLLNLPLVNHEHRKIAQHLIDEVPRSSRGVLFLESGADVAVRDNDNTQNSTPLKALTTWPLNLLMLQLGALGLLYCLWRFPIFGRPREMRSGIVWVDRHGQREAIQTEFGKQQEGAEPGPSSFGKHLDAVARQLSINGDQEYVREQVAQYQQHTRNDSEVSHAESQRNSPTPPDR